MTPEEPRRQLAAHRSGYQRPAAACAAGDEVAEVAGPAGQGATRLGLEACTIKAEVIHAEV